MRYMDNQARSVLIGERIFNETELACRLEVELEKYTMKVQIESRVLGDLAINHIVPTAVIIRTAYWRICEDYGKSSHRKSMKCSVPTARNSYAKYPTA